MAAVIKSMQLFMLRSTHRFNALAVMMQGYSPGPTYDNFPCIRILESVAALGTVLVAVFPLPVPKAWVILLNRTIWKLSSA